VHAYEEILACESFVNEAEIGGDHHRVRVLDEHRGHRRAVAEVSAVAG